MKIKTWYELRGYVENSITKFLKEEDITVNKLALFLEINPIELKLFCRYGDSELPNNLKLVMSILSFMRFNGYSKTSFIDAYMQYKRSLDNPPF